MSRGVIKRSKSTPLGQAYTRGYFWLNPLSWCYDYGVVRVLAVRRGPQPFSRNSNPAPTPYFQFRTHFEVGRKRALCAKGRRHTLGKKRYSGAAGRVCESWQEGQSCETLPPVDEATRPARGLVVARPWREHFLTLDTWPAL